VQVVRGLCAEDSRGRVRVSGMVVCWSLQEWQGPIAAPRPSRVEKWQAVSGCEALRGVPAVSIVVTWRREVTIQTASASRLG
jgi:hypothetical protein